MSTKPRGRFRSVRGQKIVKEFMKEELMRSANIKYVRTNNVANEDGRRVNLASRPTRQSPIKDNNSNCKDTFTVNENLDALPRGSNKSNSPMVLMSKVMEQSAISCRKNIKNTRCGDGISLEEETHVSMGSKDDWISGLENSKGQVPLTMKATIQGTNNVESLQSTIVHDEPISRLLQTTQAHVQREHSLMNDVSGNVNDLGSRSINLSPSQDSIDQRSWVVKIKESTPLEKGIEGSMQPQFKAMEGLIHKDNNVNGVIKYKDCPSRVKEGSTSVQVMEGLIHKMEDVDGSTKHNSVTSLMSKKRPCSFEGIGTEEVNDEVAQDRDGPSSKAMKSERRYIETDEDEGGDANHKNPMGVKTNNVGEIDGGNKIPACVKDDYKVVVQLENMTCGAMEEQRETKQDIEPDDGGQNLVDEGDNDGDIRVGYPITMNNEAISDVQSLMGVDGETHDFKGRKESMHEERYVTLDDYDDDDDKDDDDDDDSEEVVWLTYGLKKKRSRYIVTSENEEDDLDGVGYDRVGFEGKESGESKVEAVKLMDWLAKVPMPFISECPKQQCYCCSKPIDEPVWRGTLKIDGKEYTSLAGHLSTKSGEKVWNLSRSLQTSVEVMKLCGSKVRPKIWDLSKPSDDNIGLYFFPDGMRHDANLDQLINEVMENDLILQAVIGEAEMLIFPSCLLPKRYKTFLRKHYLWASFKRREDKFAVTAEPLNGVVRCAQEDAKEKEHVPNQQDDVDDVEPHEKMIWLKSVMPFESQGLANLHHHMEKQGSEGSGRGGMDHSVSCEPPAESTQQVSASCVRGGTNIGFQLKALDEKKQEDARRYSVHTQATAAATSSATVIVEATALATNDANILANHEFNSSMGVQPGRKFYFVTRQTPRIKQILQKLELENSLIFAMQLEAIGVEPWPGSIATTMQQ